ncbi:hypothetical protein ABTF00_11500 [Acinetobacter baumannii]|uniref:hypothetical protein n=1 Tax=Acinetobacter baumannii TaxID=470 RepID=UPI001EE90E33|nr:hypothetical protein [Acinetobacter baumannii]MCG5791998.1 hypothetical protein [Acinetobacter baumannii]HAV5510592.1 hypothetical protein [Acinetobacter baumannii]
MSNQIKKAYNPSLGNTTAFFAPHPEANHLNAQDVAYELVASAKDISITTFQCFDGGNKLMINAEIVANLIIEIHTKLEMIEKILPLAFESEEA